MSSKKVESKNLEEKKEKINSRKSKKGTSSSNSTIKNTKTGGKSSTKSIASSNKTTKATTKSNTKANRKTATKTGSKVNYKNKIDEIEKTKELEELETILNEKVISSTDLKNMLKKEVKLNEKNVLKNVVVSKEDAKENNKKKEKHSSKIIVFLLLFFLILGTCVGGYSYYKYFKEQEKIELARLEEKEKIRREEEEKRILLEENSRKKQLIEVAEASVKALYNENHVPKMGITDEKIIEVLDYIDKIEEDDIKKSLNESLDKIQLFREVEKDIQSLLVKKVLISDYREETISRLNTQYDKLPNEWKKSFKSSINKIKKQKSNIKNAKSKVSALFSDKKMTKVKRNVTRSKYNAAKKAIDALPQKDIVKEYKPYLKKVLKVVVANEEKAKKEAEEKAREEAEIEKVESVLDTPSQNE